MSVAARIASRQRDRRVIDVPEWGEDDTPLSVYVGAITAGDIDKLQRKHKNFLNDMTIAAMVDLIIMKAEDQAGERLFSLEDKPVLMRDDFALIARIAGDMFAGIADVEEHEKN